MIFLIDNYVRWGCWCDAIVQIGSQGGGSEDIVSNGVNSDISYGIDYLWLNLQWLALVAICNFGCSGISIGAGGLSIIEDGDGYKLGEGDSNGSVDGFGSDWSGLNVQIVEREQLVKTGCNGVNSVISYGIGIFVVKLTELNTCCSM